MKIAMLLSGGVDSSVALNLLLRQGYTDITAYYLKIWLEDEMAYLGSCPWEEDLSYAEAVCHQAGVPLKVVPLQQEYYNRVVEYAIEELRAGRTPSPDIFCNQRIKFGAFWEKIPETADAVATGHYARIERIPAGQPLPPFARIDEQMVASIDGEVCPPYTYPRVHSWDAPYDLSLLRRSPDPVKDQSYFLSHLSQQQLQRILFPIGGYYKHEIRALAQRFDLPNKDRPDSQGICFLGNIRYPEFVGYYLGEQKGSIVERETGRKLGRHKGYWYYTIGQRQGLGLGGGPWYVVGKNVAQNIVLVSHRNTVAGARRSRFHIEKLTWTIPAIDSIGLRAGGWNSSESISGVPGTDLVDEAAIAEKEYDFAYPLLTKLRHGPHLIPCTLDPATGEVQLSGGDHGVAPGQFSVLYAGEYCLGGGRICADEVSTGYISGKAEDRQ